MPKDKHDEWVEKMKRGFELTYENLIKYKKMKNSPLVVMRDGKIVEVSADDLPPTKKMD